MVFAKPDTYPKIPIVASLYMPDSLSPIPFTPIICIFLMPPGHISSSSTPSSKTEKAGKRGNHAEMILEKNGERKNSTLCMQIS
jgi:hypothetical protein